MSSCAINLECCHILHWGGGGLRDRLGGGGTDPGKREFDQLAEINKIILPLLQFFFLLMWLPPSAVHTLNEIRDPFSPPSPFPHYLPSFHLM